MNPLTPSRTLSWLSIAIFIIATSALSTRARGQIVYRCGNSYSQIPCPGGQTVQVDDTRDAQQKRQTDEAVRQDAKQAQLLEKKRLAQEKAALKPAPVTLPSTDTTSPMTPSASDVAVVHKITPKRIQSKHHKPDVFVAQVPGSDQKKRLKKTTPKKAAQKAASSPA